VTAARVVQFPHPGPEHTPPKAGDIMAWNVSSHGRKFLRAPGRLLRPDGNPERTDVVFWGEYEAASRVTRRWPAAGALPTALQEPLISAPPESPKRQNTDPWVFGGRFLYSNCKQLTPHGSPSAMQSLPRGTVILFGSQIDGRFCLDTVFVVAESIPYTVREAGALPIDDVFRVCTIDSLAANEHPSIDLQSAGFTLYLGATYDDPVEDMFSFTPALPASDNGPRFTRPPYADSQFVNLQSKQTPSGAKKPRPISEVHQAWDSAVQACRHHGLDLAVQVSLPAAKY
jgi:hypothetical protein